MRGIRERGHTLHLKQSRWIVPSRARTNWPVRGSPHFLQMRICPLAVLPPLCRDRFRSPLLRESLSQLAWGGAEPLEPDTVGLIRWLLSGVRRPLLFWYPSLSAGKSPGMGGPGGPTSYSGPIASRTVNV